MDIIVAENSIQQQDAFQVRTLVFVEEQKVPADLEIDELENESIHFVGYEDDVPGAAGRMRLVDGYAKMERICIRKEFRGKQFGHKLMWAMEEEAKKHGMQKAKLNAQTRAIPFYERLGYTVVSEEFMDAGIPHKTMTKQL
ncbi:Predicted N-acyltransferase, GNAT family [Terribacillus halophilus]|uniref:Predicted N-acyltransferase, GNAT family n=1 Tax=Terribacillus halophilus TaxID=361279 RepID=A0A1G6PJN8_9BACI|nr:GNAT family N-acetyltransferase [Terribacillus halophilus]SDC79784.1 Predicted N-acyltransferase, GNAT family [Terribacillus halophilus]